MITDKIFLKQMQWNALVKPPLFMLNSTFPQTGPEACFILGNWGTEPLNLENLCSTFLAVRQSTSALKTNRGYGTKENQILVYSAGQDLCVLQGLVFECLCYTSCTDNPNIFSFCNNNRNWVFIFIFIFRFYQMMLPSFEFVSIRRRIPYLVFKWILKITSSFANLIECFKLLKFILNSF